MRQPLPLVLSSRDLPLPELTAARLDGELFALGAGFAPVDELESSRHRATALRAGLHERLIAEQHTAAWVWGALATAPSPHEYCSTLNARVGHLSTRWLTVREVVIEPSEIEVIAGLALTVPLRTAVDLTRFSRVFGASEAAVVGQLAALGGFGIDDCIAELDRRRNLPHKRQAFLRFRSLQRSLG
jgi:hypothetical protein